MDEARRWFRFIPPGVLFTLETLLLFTILTWPNAGECWRGAKEGPLALPIAVFAAAWACGAVLGHVHHGLWGLRWYSRFRPHQAALVRQLIGEELLQVDCLGKASDGGGPLGKDDQVSEDAAWLVITCLWNERLETNLAFKTAIGRNNSLADITHGACSALVGACLCGLLALVATVGLMCAGAFRTEWHPSTAEVVCRFGAAGLLWLSVFLWHRWVADRLVGQYDAALGILTVDCLRSAQRPANPALPKSRGAEAEAPVVTIPTEHWNRLIGRRPPHTVASLTRDGANLWGARVTVAPVKCVQEPCGVLSVALMCDPGATANDPDGSECIRAIIAEGAAGVRANAGKVRGTYYGKGANVLVVDAFESAQATSDAT